MHDGLPLAEVLQTMAAWRREASRKGFVLPCDALKGLSPRAVEAGAAERRQQRGVDVQDAPWERPNQLSGYQLPRARERSAFPYRSIEDWPSAQSAPPFLSSGRLASAAGRSTPDDKRQVGCIADLQRLCGPTLRHVP